MAKNKLKRFAEISTYNHVIQPSIEEVFNIDYPLKGKWKSGFFRNNHPLVLELGCGKGEYTVGLAKKYPQKNFIGVDIKGARIWRGAKTVQDEQIENAAFLRTRIEFINSFFAPAEVDEIWITFPDPQMKQRREKKRLPGAYFLNEYKKFLKPNGIVHLKTDSDFLYGCTLKILKANHLEILINTTDLYKDLAGDEILSIRTHYENIFLQKGENINYLKFKLSGLDEPIEETNEMQTK